jgi:hypothetical protein
VLACSIGTIKSQSSKAMARLRVDETLIAFAKEHRDDF